MAIRAFFQVISRNNDINGNPYRLLVVYDDYCNVHHIAEARSSSPNYAIELRKQGLKQMMNIHVAPAEYNGIKRSFIHCLKNVD